MSQSLPDRECKCGLNMKRIAHEKDYGDTTALVYWCSACGRVLVDDWGPVSRGTSRKDMWYAPLRTIEDER